MYRDVDLLMSEKQPKNDLKNDYKLVTPPVAEKDRQNTQHKFVKKSHGDVKVAQPAQEPSQTQT